MNETNFDKLLMLARIGFLLMVIKFTAEIFFLPGN